MTDVYGIEIDCAEDMIPGRVVTGAKLVQQSIFRRCTTPPNTVIDDEDHYYFDAGEYLQSALSNAATQALAFDVERVCATDDRIVSFTVDVDETVPAEQVRIVIGGVLSNEEEFSLVFDVTEAASAIVSEVNS